MEKELKQLVREITSQNKLISLLIAKYDVDPFKADGWYKSKEEFLEDMKELAQSIIDWSYNPTESTIQFNHPKESTKNSTN